MQELAIIAKLIHITNDFVDSVINQNGQNCYNSSGSTQSIYQENRTVSQLRVTRANRNNLEDERLAKKTTHTVINDELVEIIDEAVNIMKFPLIYDLVDQQCIRVGETLLHVFEHDIERKIKKVVPGGGYTFSQETALNFKSTIKEEMRLRLGIDDIDDTSRNVCLSKVETKRTSVIWHPPVVWRCKCQCTNESDCEPVPWISCYLPLNDSSAFSIIFRTLLEMEIRKLKYENQRYHTMIEKSHRVEQYELSHFLATIGLSYLYPVFDTQSFVPKVISGITKDMLPEGLNAGEKSRIIKAAETYKADPKCYDLQLVLKYKQKIERYEEILKRINKVTKIDINTLDDYEQMVQAIDQQKMVLYNSSNHTKYHCPNCNKEMMVCTHLTGKSQSSKSLHKKEDENAKFDVNLPSRPASPMKKSQDPKKVNELDVYLYAQKNSSPPKNARKNSVSPTKK